MQQTKGFIFDLDGVIVDTAKYHFLAWRSLANQLGFDFTENDNEKLKGISRVKSLEMILEWGNITLPEEEFNKQMAVFLLNLITSSNFTNLVFSKYLK